MNNILKERALHLPEGVQSESRRGDVTGRGVGFAIHNELINSKAFKSLSAVSKAAYLYIRASDNVKTFPVYVKLSLDDFIEYGICTSKDTMLKVKKEMVEVGILAQVQNDSGDVTNKLKLSERWRWYGTDHFCHVPYLQNHISQE